MKAILSNLCVPVPLPSGWLLSFAINGKRINEKFVEIEFQHVDSQNLSLALIKIIRQWQREEDDMHAMCDMTASDGKAVSIDVIIHPN